MVLFLLVEIDVIPTKAGIDLLLAQQWTTASAEATARVV
jgi:hypothetical protein